MPWEVDYMLLTFTQLKKSFYHLPKDVTINIYSALNLSSYIIDWNTSKLPKEFFINKYEQTSKLLKDYNHIPFIYDKDELWGHMDLYKSSLSSEATHYIGLCPDMYFSEYLLNYLIEGAKQVKNKYFVITPQISKLWDHTWDEITNPQYHNISYDKWKEVDIFDIRNNTKQSGEPIELISTQNSKWAGWFDIYSKSLVEELCSLHNNWSGYCGWDFYSMLISEHCKKQGVDFQQYLLKGETIFEYSVGPLKDGGFSNYYKDLLVLNKNPSQRENWDNNLQGYIFKQIETLKQKGII